MTAPKDDDMIRTERALGLLGPEQSARGGAAPDPAATEMDLALAGLSALAPEAEPPAGLLDAIEADIEREAPDGARTVRAEGGRWVRRMPGVWMKVLNDDPARGRCTYLLKCDPGAVVPEHEHHGDEELFVIEGDISFGAMRLGPGDFHFARMGTVHEPAMTDAGCVVLMRVA